MTKLIEQRMIKIGMKTYLIQDVLEIMIPIGQQHGTSKK